MFCYYADESWDHVWACLCSVVAQFCHSNEAFTSCVFFFLHDINRIFCTSWCQMSKPVITDTAAPMACYPQPRRLELVGNCFWLKACNHCLSSHIEFDTQHKAHVCVKAVFGSSVSGIFLASVSELGGFGFALWRHRVRAGAKCPVSPFGGTRTWLVDHTWWCRNSTGAGTYTDRKRTPFKESRIFVTQNSISPWEISISINIRVHHYSVCRYKKFNVELIQGLSIFTSIQSADRYCLPLSISPFFKGLDTVSESFPANSLRSST